MSRVERTLHRRSVDGEDRAMAAASALVRESAWFEVEPLPEGRWVFAVKVDRRPTLDHIVARVELIPREAHDV